MIDEYAFGRMSIGGTLYTADLVIYPHRIDPSWWRLQGHHLQMEDLKDILAENPRLLIVGTGAMGVMRVPRQLKQEIAGLGIELFAERTGKAVKRYNEVAQGDVRVIAAFHLTC